jgi:hypothetical protein
VTEAAGRRPRSSRLSELNVEREDESDDLEAPPRPQSEATIVSDTSHIPGVAVANIKSRKRKPKATEPAGDAG